MKLHILIAMVLFGSCPVAIGGEAEVKLIPATTDLRVGDPLIVRVEIRNTTKEPLIGYREVSALRGTVGFGLLRPGDSEYKVVSSSIASDDPGLPEPGSFVLAPGERVESDAVLFLQPNGWAFSRPGEYKLRAGVGRCGIEGRSPPIDIVVREIPESEWNRIQQQRRMLGYTVRLVGVGHESRTELKALHDDLGASELKSTLEWALAILRVKDANTKAGYDEALRDLRRIQQRHTPLMQQAISLALVGSVFFKAEQDAEAEAELRTFHPGNANRNNFLVNIRERARERKLMELMRLQHQ